VTILSISYTLNRRLSDRKDNNDVTWWWWLMLVLLQLFVIRCFDLIQLQLYSIDALDTEVAIKIGRVAVSIVYFVVDSGGSNDMNIRWWYLGNSLVLLQLRCYPTT
jgi:hypothetical protein